MADPAQYTGDVDRKKIAEEIMAMVKNGLVTDFYDEEEALGEGAYGRVWVGVRSSDGERFAVKTIGGGDDGTLGTEVKVMLEANHPNLVKVHEIYRQAGSKEMHLVMDLVEPFEDLAQSDLFEYVVSIGPLDPKQCAQLVYQTADAIKYLNNFENAMHRDLKPENILLGSELFDRVRVTDYGLARVFTSGLGEAAVACTANVGSDGYQAPETMNKHGSQTMYSKQVDIWSLGCIAYICCAQAPPFGLGNSARLRDISQGKFKPMTGPKWKAVDPEMKNLIKAMLTVLPEKRITVDDLLKNEYLKKTAGIPTEPAEMEAALEADLARAAAAQKA